MHSSDKKKKYIYLSILFLKLSYQTKRNDKTQCTKKLAQTLELKKKIISLEAMSTVETNFNNEANFFIDFHESAEILIMTT